MASLDNLGKGASGAAVQVINLKTGVDEDGAEGGGLVFRAARLPPARLQHYQGRCTQRLASTGVLESCTLWPARSGWHSR